MHESQDKVIAAGKADDKIHIQRTHESLVHPLEGQNCKI